MNIKEMRELYKEFYFRGMDKQESIYARLKLALPTFVLLASASLFLAEKILLIVNTGAILDTLSLLAIVFSIVVFGYLCYCVYRGFVGWKYYEIPLTELDEYYDKLMKCCEKYCSEHDKQRVESMINEAFDKKLIKWFAECAKHNQNTNKRRSAYVKKYFAILPLHLFALALLYFLFYIR